MAANEVSVRGGAAPDPALNPRRRARRSVGLFTGQHPVARKLRRLPFGCLYGGYAKSNPFDARWRLPSEDFDLSGVGRAMIGWIRAYDSDASLWERVTNTF